MKTPVVKFPGRDNIKTRLSYENLFHPPTPPVPAKASENEESSPVKTKKVKFIDQNNNDK